MKSRIKIVFIITDLDIGGAEEMLYQLISRLEKESYAVELISLSKYGVMAQKFMRLGVPIRSLEMNSKAFNPFKFLKLVTWLKEINPDIIQTWMYHANLLGGIAGRLSSKVPIIWGIHHANLDIKYTKLATLIIVKICAMLSFFLPKRIVYCSQKAIETHIKFGYDCTKSIYIPNGFSTDRFFPSIQKRTDFRDSLGLKFDTPLIGMAARFHPIKDHENFISAAAKLHKEMPEVKFVLCGTGIETSNTTLMNKIIENNLESSVLLLGYRSDMANFYNGIDVGTLTSISEAFPNVVGEMMACGLPVVITDVGDASDIVGDCGIVVPAKEPQALADAWMQTLMMKENERIELGKRAAHRIAHYFSIDLVVQSYKNLHEEIISQEIC